MYAFLVHFANLYRMELFQKGVHSGGCGRKTFHTLTSLDIALTHMVVYVYNCFAYSNFYGCVAQKKSQGSFGYAILLSKEAMQLGKSRERSRNFLAV